MQLSSSPPRFGVISNPAARLNRADPAVQRALVGRPGIPLAVLHEGEPIVAAAAEMGRQGVTDLVIDGGDGTVIAAISAALQAGTFAVPPRFIVVPSGTTNLIAERIGTRGPRNSVIDRLLAATTNSLEAQTLSHAPMQVDRGEGLPRLHGFLLGAAAFRTGTLLTQRSLGNLGFVRNAAIAAGIAASAWRAAWGADRKAFLAGEPLAVDVDGRRLPGERQFLVLVSTLDRLTMGLRPFWGDGAGPLRWLSIVAPPRDLLKALPRVLLGRPGAWMQDAGYRSGRVAKLHLSTTQPFVLDGEIVVPGRTGQVEISPGPLLRFLRLS